MLFNKSRNQVINSQKLSLATQEKNVFFQLRKWFLALVRWDISVWHKHNFWRILKKWNIII